jgi:radical SAM superfamily enzyme YgiQ (UPF0313 family)
MKVLPNLNRDPNIDLSDLHFTFIFYNYKETSNIMVPQGYLEDVLGNTPSMSALYVAAVLTKYGCNVKIIDAAVNAWGIEETLEELRKTSPDVVGFTVCSADFNLNSKKWIEAVKREIGCKVVVGGELAREYPEELLLACQAIDAVVPGQADFALGPLLAAWRDEQPLSGVSGIAFRNEDGGVTNTGPSEQLSDYDAFPFLPYHLLPIEKYVTPGARYKNYVGFLSARSCPFSCSYCVESVWKYVAMSPKRAVDEMEWLHYELGVREFDFWDPTFNINKKRLINFCEELVRRGLKIHFAVRGRVDLMDAEQLAQLKAAGCYRVQYGIESSDAAVLANMNRRERGSPDQTRAMVEETKRQGIEVAGYMIYGLKCQSRDSLERSLDYVSSLKLDHIIGLPAYHGPGTEIYREWSDEHDGADFWRDIILSGENDITTLLAGAPQYYSLEERIAFMGRYLRAVYMRPDQIVKTLLRDTRNPKIIMAKVKAVRQVFKIALR